MARSLPGTPCRKAFLLFTFLLAVHVSFSQEVDSIKVLSHFSGSAAVTNNGISIVPSFSLGKPAVIFNLSMGKNRFSFDPDLRFSLAGKPWSFLFWGRYKLADSGRFQMSAGTHLGLNFKTSVLPINGDTSETTVTRRYLAGELFPRYLLTKNISIGIYYLYSHGLDAGTIGNTNFLTFQTGFSKLLDIFHAKAQKLKTQRRKILIFNTLRLCENFASLREIKMSSSVGFFKYRTTEAAFHEVYAAILLFETG